MNVLLLIEVRVTAGHEVNYEYIVNQLRASLENGDFRAGNPDYSWHVHSAKEAIAP